MQKSNCKIFNRNNRTGLRLRFESGTDAVLRGTFLRFSRWLRKEYEFPIRVLVYIKNRDFIVAADGDHVAGMFFAPYDKTQEPYVKIAVGDYVREREKRNHRELAYDFCSLLAHELTHYYQWLQGNSLTARGEEWQASFYAKQVVYEYIETMDDAENFSDMT